MSDREPVLRVALTETRNVFAEMPGRVEELAALAGRLAEVRAANLAHHRALAARAAEAGARLVCFGELFAGPYFALSREPLWHEFAEDVREGPSVLLAAEIAREHEVVVVAPIYERDAASGRRFNTAVVVDAGGEWLGAYRKNHIPRGANERAAFDERFYYQPGDGAAPRGPKTRAASPYFPVFETAVCRLGIAICYDRHFPGSVASLAAAGAELVLSPAVTFGEKSRRLWHREFEVDAARHGLFVGGSNRLGAEAPWNVAFFGHSHIAGPDGVLPRLASPEGIALFDLDLTRLAADDPAGWNLARDARPGIYVHDREHPGREGPER